MRSSQKTARSTNQEEHHTGASESTNYLEALSDSRCGAPLLGVIHTLLKVAICCSAAGDVSTCAAAIIANVSSDTTIGLRVLLVAHTGFGIFSTSSLPVAEASIY